MLDGFRKHPLLQLHNCKIAHLCGFIPFPHIVHFAPGVPIGLCPHGVAFMIERRISRAVYSYVVFYAL